jgi:ATP/maltotriose-dependent transcriptional regulator MalT
MSIGAPQGEVTDQAVWPYAGRHVPRPRLVERLAAAGDEPVVLLGAPPGYGKTSVLSEWLRCERGRRRFAWLALGPMDAEPRRLLALLIGAVRQRFAAFDCRIGPTLPDSGTGQAVEAAVPRFLDELAGLPEPLVIVLDDYHRLRGARIHGLMEAVVGGLPPTVQLAIATRADPPLPLARRRAGGAVVELRVPDLRFDRGEVAELVAASGPELGPEARRSVTADLLAATEGWPAGVALGLRALRTEDDPVAFAHRFAGTHRDVRDFVTEEVLRHQTPGLRTFLVHTSILRRMTGGLCDAVLDGTGSQAVLEQIERANLFVAPLDDERRWYRYHRPFVDVLRAELRRSRPDLVADLHRRASAWFDAAGDHREAADHALAALRLAGPPRRRDRHAAAVLPGAAAAAGPRPGSDDGGGVAGDDVAAAGGPSDPFPATRPDIPGIPDVPDFPADQGLEFGQHLTDRELTILRLMRTRLSQREIADELFVSVNTVKTHSRAIYRKLGVSSRQEATARARELELLDGPGPGARRAAGGAIAS